MKVIFFTPYPIGKAGSQRFRFEQYFNAMRNSNIDFLVKPFLSDKTWDIIYSKGNLWKKIIGITKGFVLRLVSLFQLYKYDFVFIHRECAPIGPPIIEWVIFKVWNKKVIYDFDDAIWLPNFSESNRYFSFLKRYSNISYLCKWSHRVSCGNGYLANYAKQYSKNVIVNPTTIDTECLHNKEKKLNENFGKLTIGWTGSHSTERYLDEIIPVLSELEMEYDFRFLVISDSNPNLSLNCFEYKKWSKSTEIDSLMEIDIGVMPLSNDLWANGKCGFKALQYMSLGIPAIVSSVKVNKEIVDNGVNGFVCSNHKEWKEKLALLLSSKETLIQLGSEARRKIVDNYSVTSNTNNFLSLFKL